MDDLAMDVGWVLPENGSGSFETLARTTTDRMRVGGATTGRFLAKYDDHTQRLAHSSRRDQAAFDLPQRQ